MRKIAGAITTDLSNFHNCYLDIVNNYTNDALATSLGAKSGVMIMSSDSYNQGVMANGDDKYRLEYAEFKNKLDNHYSAYLAFITSPEVLVSFDVDYNRGFYRQVKDNITELQQLISQAEDIAKQYGLDTYCTTPLIRTPTTPKGIPDKVVVG